jgi:hypothetical protein
MLQVRLRNRGNAILEFALVLPILIALILYSLFFSEIVCVKLRLLEVVRYAAWEMGSHPLSDYGTASPQKAFERAKAQTIRDAEARYAGLDSVELTRSNVLGQIEKLELEIAQADAPWIAANAASPPGSQGDGWSEAIFGALASGPARLLKGWGYNTGGQLRIDANAVLGNRLLPQHFLDRSAGGFFRVDFFGGRNLTRLSLRTGIALIADGWTLPDGADSVMKNSRAGQHREGSQSSGLYRQVQRMGFLGLRGRLERVPAVSSVLGLLHSVAPDPIGTYVVSHNYAPDPPGAYSRDCNAPTYPASARGGLNNLQKVSLLDSDRPRCFDTAPFRDQASYEDSLYIQMFLARGGWFMGCKNAQADDPSSTDDFEIRGETSGVPCE